MKYDLPPPQIGNLMISWVNKSGKIEFISLRTTTQKTNEVFFSGGVILSFLVWLREMQVVQ